jgi:UDP-N-acetylglucosamine 2-epimerase
MSGERMKVLSIVGARPQFIKAAVVSRQIRAGGLEERLLHTGQHYDFNMSEVFFRELGLPEPDYYLGIGSGRHGAQTAGMLAGIEDVLLKEDPDVVLIYGDTNTTLAGALAPVKLHIPVAHVEAGLRSHNRRMPEEINRILADHCSDVLFCPTQTAVRNLEGEGFANILNNGRLLPLGLASPADGSAGPLVANIGDVMLDVARRAKQLLDAEPRRRRDLLDRLGVQPRQYVLATIHRAANTDDPDKLRGILDAMKQVGSTGLKVVFPVHPRTRKSLERFNLLGTVDAETVVLTDSGGVQKEAYFFGVPCVVARDETEWTELVEIGWNRIAGAKTASVVEAVNAILAEDFTNKRREDFYGDGNASTRIVTILGWL